MQRCGPCHGRRDTHIHASDSLYLAREQDRQLRKYADRADLTVSEVLRSALAEYLDGSSRHRRTDDVIPEDATRLAIAESARLRKLARGPRRAAPIPGQIISGDTVFWHPPPALRPPTTRQQYPKREYPMSVDRDGNPIEPPANAVGWRVLIRRHRHGHLEEFRMRDAPLVLDLRVKHYEFAYAVSHRSAAFYLEPIDQLGRVLRFEPIYVPLRAATDWDEE